MMLSLEEQEKYRQRYAEMRPGWRPSSHVYRDLVAARLDPGARVLDLGCGRGGIVEELHSRAGAVFGLDPDAQSLGEYRAPGSVSLAQGLADAVPYADASFDLVCSSWVLEHLREPAVAFAELRRVLVSGGRFIFLTPNVRHPLLMLNRALAWTEGRLVDRLYDRAEPDIFPAFYRANSAEQIQRLTEEARMEPVSLRFVGDPTYLAFNDPLFRFSCLLERVMPERRWVHLVGEYEVSR